MITKNIFAELLARVRGATDALVAAGGLPAGLDQSRVTVEPPRDPSHGDIATNAAMVLAKDAGKKPRDLAEAIAEKLRADDLVASVDVAGAGFINLTLKAGAWLDALRGAVRLGSEYGKSDIGGGVPVNVEYVSANPTGPMHVGHGRGAVFGDALANLLAFTSYRVTREYYVNDAGAQVDALARSAYLRYREALGEDIGTIPEGLYPGDYLKPVGALIARTFGATLKDAPEAERLSVVRAIVLEEMMKSIREDLAALGVSQEHFFYERTLIFQEEQGANSVDHIARVIEWLRERGYIYQGRLPPPKGALPDDWEDREQTLFRSTAFGDDVDRPLKKSDGSWTYFAADIAYHFDKYRRGFPEMIDVLGADHGGYVKRMQAAVKALTRGAGVLDAKLCQLVNLFDQGQPVRMSKRAGTFITLREVVDEVGKGAFRFMMLTRRNDQAIDFDFAKVKEQSKDNPVFYVQYAHARAASVLRHGREALGDEAVESLTDSLLERLTAVEELGLVKHLAGWPRLVESAAETHEPHRIAFYLQDLSALFHMLWNKGKDDATLRFIVSGDKSLTQARLALVQGIKHVIASGLSVFGVEPIEEMR